MVGPEQICSAPQAKSGAKVRDLSCQIHKNILRDLADIAPLCHSSNAGQLAVQQPILCYQQRQLIAGPLPARLSTLCQITRLGMEKNPAPLPNSTAEHQLP